MNEKTDFVLNDDDAEIRALWMANKSAEQIAEQKGVRLIHVREWIRRNVRDNGDLK